MKQQLKVISFLSLSTCTRVLFYKSGSNWPEDSPCHIVLTCFLMSVRISPPSQDVGEMPLLFIFQINRVVRWVELRSVELPLGSSSSQLNFPLDRAPLRPDIIPKSTPSCSPSSMLAMWIPIIFATMDPYHPCHIISFPPSLVKEEVFGLIEHLPIPKLKDFRHEGLRGLTYLGWAPLLYLLVWAN